MKKGMLLNLHKKEAIRNQTNLALSRRGKANKI
jgi:hypothetical protein